MLRKKTDIEKFIVWFAWFIAIYFIMALLTNRGFGAEPNLTKGQKIVAMTILGEARGEGKSGMYAVACVIQQRAKNRNMSASRVCLQHNQFSCWNGSDKNRAKLPRLLSIPQAEYAKHLAVNLHKLQLDYVKNADHYCTTKLWKRRPPSWLKGQKQVATIGNHTFFRLK